MALIDSAAEDEAGVDEGEEEGEDASEVDGTHGEFVERN